MNELIFFIHILTIFGCALIALKLGKDALVTWVAFQAVLANLFVLKQITFLGLNITCSDAFAIGSILGLNLLRQYYTPQSAKKALQICFFSMLFFVLMVQFHLAYQPNAFDNTQTAYTTILSHSPRILMASIGVFLLIQRIDLYLFDLFKKLPLLARNSLSITCSQLLDTCLFSLFGLWGLIDSLWEVMLVSVLIKLIVIALSTPFVTFAQYFIPVQQERT